MRLAPVAISQLPELLSMAQSFRYHSWFESPSLAQLCMVELFQIYTILEKQIPLVAVLVTGQFTGLQPEDIKEALLRFDGSAGYVLSDDERRHLDPMIP